MLPWAPGDCDSHFFFSNFKQLDVLEIKQENNQQISITAQCLEYVTTTINCALSFFFHSAL